MTLSFLVAQRFSAAVTALLSLAVSAAEVVMQIEKEFFRNLFRQTTYF
jgi:hypothetical protein